MLVATALVAAWTPAAVAAPPVSRFATHWQLDDDADIEITTRLVQVTCPGLDRQACENVPQPSFVDVPPSSPPEPDASTTPPEPTTDPPAPPASPPDLPRAQRPFAWAEDVVAACVTFVQGVTPRQALAALVPAPTFGPGRPADVWRRVSEGDGVGLAVGGAVGGGAYVWQDNAYSCSTPGTVRTLRGARRFVSAYWNVNALTQLTVAVRGRILRAVDVVVEEHTVGRPRPSERGIDWDHWTSGLLAVLERETGVRITDADWALRHAAVAAVEGL